MSEMLRSDPLPKRPSGCRCLKLPSFSSGPGWMRRCSPLVSRGAAGDRLQVTNRTLAMSLMYEPVTEESQLL